MYRVKTLVARLWGNVMVRRVVHTFWQAYLAVFILGVPAVARLWGNVMVRRVVHTFWQAYLAVFILGVPAVVHFNNGFHISFDNKALVALVIASGAAGLAALRTGIYNVWLNRKV